VRHAFAGFASVYGGDVDFDGAAWPGPNDELGLYSSRVGSSAWKGFNSITIALCVHIQNELECDSFSKNSKEQPRNQ
jgi:hypothetical protein